MQGCRSAHARTQPHARSLALQTPAVLWQQMQSMLCPPGLTAPRPPRRFLLNGLAITVHSIGLAAEISHSDCLWPSAHRLLFTISVAGLASLQSYIAWRTSGSRRYMDSALRCSISSCSICSSSLYGMPVSVVEAKLGIEGTQEQR